MRNRSNDSTNIALLAIRYERYSGNKIANFFVLLITKFEKAIGFDSICLSFFVCSVSFACFVSSLEKSRRQEDLSELCPSVYLTKYVFVPLLLNLGHIIHLRFAAVGRIYPSVVSTPYFTVHCQFNWKIVAMTLSWCEVIAARRRRRYRSSSLDCRPRDPSR